MLCELNGTFAHSHAKPFTIQVRKKKKKTLFVLLYVTEASSLRASLDFFRPTSLGYHPKIRVGYKEHTFSQLPLIFLGLHPWATALKLGKVTRRTPFPYIFFFFNN
jgi:prolipoprotein diacylglyceryltransferase